MKKTPLSIIFLIVFIDLLGFGIIIPILPIYAQRGFGASDFSVGLLVASFSLMQLVSTPFWGRISDRVGRKPVLMFSLVCSVFGYILFGIAGSLPILFASRLLAGVGGGNISAAQAYIADVTTQHERAKGMGLIGAAFGLGFVFGPVIGGLLSTYGYSLPGFAAAFLSFTALITTIFLLPEPQRADHQAAERDKLSLKSFTSALSRPKVGVLLILFFLITFGYANIYATFPLLASRDFGYSEHEVGFLFGFIGIIGALTQGGLIRLFTKKAEERTLFLIGTALTMVGLAFIPVHVNAIVLHLVLAVLSVGSGLVTPMVLSMLSKNSSAHEQGGVLGVNQALGALARALGPVWGSFVFGAYGHGYPFYTGAAVMLVVFIIAWKSI